MGTMRAAGKVESGDELTNYERVSNEGCQISITHMSRWIIAGWEWENIVEGVQTEENQ
jgi:hypothetical protein